jgi:hypothetical protein
MESKTTGRWRGTSGPKPSKPRAKKKRNTTEATVTLDLKSENISKELAILGELLCFDEAFKRSSGNALGRSNQHSGAPAYADALSKTDGIVKAYFKEHKVHPELAALVDECSRKHLGKAHTPAEVRKRSSEDEPSTSSPKRVCVKREADVLVLSSPEPSDKEQDYLKQLEELEAEAESVRQKIAQVKAAEANKRSFDQVRRAIATHIDGVLQGTNVSANDVARELVREGFVDEKSLRELETTDVRALSLRPQLKMFVCKIIVTQLKTIVVSTQE